MPVLRVAFALPGLEGLVVLEAVQILAAIIALLWGAREIWRGLKGGDGCT